MGKHHGRCGLYQLTRGRIIEERALVDYLIGKKYFKEIIMRKIILLLLVTFLVLSIAACGNQYSDLLDELFSDDLVTELQRVTTQAEDSVRDGGETENLWEDEAWLAENVFEQELQVTYLDVNSVDIPEWVHILGGRETPSVYQIKHTPRFAYTEEGFNVIKNIDDSDFFFSGMYMLEFNDLEKLNYYTTIIDFTGGSGNIDMTPATRNIHNSYSWRNNIGSPIVKITLNPIYITVGDFNNLPLQSTHEIEVTDGTFHISSVAYYIGYFDDQKAEAIIVFLPYPRAIEHEHMFIFGDNESYYIQSRHNGHVSPPIMRFHFYDGSCLATPLWYSPSITPQSIVRNDDYLVNIQRIDLDLFTGRELPDNFRPQAFDRRVNMENVFELGVYNAASFDEDADVLYFNVREVTQESGETANRAFILYRQVCRDTAWVLHSYRQPAGKRFWNHNNAADIIRENFNAIYTASSYPANIGDMNLYHVIQRGTDIRYDVGFMANYNPFNWAVFGDIPERVHFR